MRYFLFIAKKFNSRKTLSGRTRVMRSIATVGVTIAVAALVVATSIGNGFEKEYLKGILNFNAHLVIGTGGDVSDPRSLYDTISGVDAKKAGVDAFTPFLYRESLLIGGGAIRGIVVKGIDPDTIASVNKMKFSTFNGGSLTDALSAKCDKGASVVLGRALYRKLNDNRKLKFMLPREKSERTAEACVVGTFESGIHDYDADFALMAISDARKLYSVGGETISGMEIRLDDPFKSDEAKFKLEELLGGRYQIMTWGELNGELVSAVKLERIVTALILGLIVLVAMLNIVAVMVITLIGRMSAYSIMKVIGLSDRVVSLVFMYGGMGVCLLGSIAGIIIGVAVSLVVGKFHLIWLDPEIYLIGSLPIDISPAICGLILTFCIFTGFISSWLSTFALKDISISDGLRGAK